MTYLDDTEENSGGQTTLMYRLYQNGAWSDGKPVDKTGRLDTAAQMFSHNGFTYVMYENSDVAITEDMSEEEILQHLTLKVARYDEESQTFDKVVTLREAGKIGVINTSLRQTEQICMPFGAKTLLVMHC